MIKSMTGYGKVSVQEAGVSVTASLKSTNHRFLDVQVRLPAGLEALEPLIRRAARESVLRGHVEIFITAEQDQAPRLQIDHKLVQAYATACQNLRTNYGFGGEPDPVSVLRIPGVVTGSNGEISAAELELIERVVSQATRQALARLNEMRAEEGRALELDLRGRLERLEQLRSSIELLSRRSGEVYQHRTEARVSEMLGSIELDAARIAQEIAYLVSRSDITEELIRFKSHVEQCEHLLSEGAEAGKKLDFLLQELNREVNTLLSKTTDVPEVGIEIGRQAVEMKAEIEKLREQAQNIE
jgi:uncharacterized protein (TIGR00255 family)